MTSWSRGWRRAVGGGVYSDFVLFGQHISYSNLGEIRWYDGLSAYGLKLRHEDFVANSKTDLDIWSRLPMLLETLFVTIAVYARRWIHDIWSGLGISSVIFVVTIVECVRRWSGCLSWRPIPVVWHIRISISQRIRWNSLRLRLGLIRLMMNIGG